MAKKLRKGFYISCVGIILVFLSVFLRNYELIVGQAVSFYLGLTVVIASIMYMFYVLITSKE